WTSKRRASVVPDAVQHKRKRSDAPQIRDRHQPTRRPGSDPGPSAFRRTAALRDPLEPTAHRRLLLRRYLVRRLRDQSGERDLAEFGEVDPLGRPHGARDAARLRIAAARLPGRAAAADLLTA